MLQIGETSKKWRKSAAKKQKGRLASKANIPLFFTASARILPLQTPKALSGEMNCGQCEAIKL